MIVKIGKFFATARGKSFCYATGGILKRLVAKKVLPVISFPKEEIEGPRKIFIEASTVPDTRKYHHSIPLHETVRGCKV